MFLGLFRVDVRVVLSPIRCNMSTCPCFRLIFASGRAIGCSSSASSNPLSLLKTSSAAPGLRFHDLLSIYFALDQ